MPRITVSVSLERYAELQRANAACNERARRVNPQDSPASLEDTAAVALCFGLERVRQLWYREELRGQAAGEQAPAPADFAWVQP